MNKLKLPPAVDRSYLPLQVNNEGWWLVIGDQHIPYHDVKTLELAIKLAKKRKVAGVLLNGDVLDSHYLSRFDKDPSAPRYCAEIQAGKEFLAYLRQELPESRIIYKAGNHDERLRVYIIQKAEALFGLEAVTLPVLLELKKYGVEFVEDKRVIRLGSLNVIHGHEYPGGVQSPVNPARGLFLKAKASALTAHFHQTSEHHEPDISGKPKGAWSIGCSCSLNPSYLPLNKWNLGFGFVDVCGERFSVENKRVLDGEVV